MGALSQLPADQSYQQQTRYDASQSSYSSQGLTDQTPYATQSLEGSSTGFGGQADLSSTGGVPVEYGSSQTTSTSGTLKDLPEFPNPPVETQQVTFPQHPVPSSDNLKMKSCHYCWSVCKTAQFFCNAALKKSKDCWISHASSWRGHNIIMINIEQDVFSQPATSVDSVCS